MLKEIFNRMPHNLNKTLEEMDGENWGLPPADSTNLIKTIYQLRKKRLADFSVEDLRVVIGQNFDLEFLVPLAIDKLEKNILAEGDYYEGDLLTNVLNIDKKFWIENNQYWAAISELLRANRAILEELDDKNILISIAAFQSIKK